MNDILELIKEKGFKLTPQRIAVIHALFHCGKFFTAQQIWQDVKKVQPEIGFDTIYRNLNLLANLGVLNQISSPSRDGYLFEVVTSHHHHLICLACGKTQCLDYCPIEPAKLNESQTDGFQIVGHSFELYGYCKECKNKN
ncbi:MAG: Fur family transcriptional regulator [Veillonellales bacterium]